MIIGYFIYHENYDVFVISAITIGYLHLINVYLNNKKKENELLENEDNIKIASEKNRIAIEMHDDLGADLSNLLFKLRIYQNHFKSHNMEDYNEIENFTKSIIKKVNETIWTLNSEKDNLKSLFNFMLKFLDDFLTPKNISFEFNEFNLNNERSMTVDKRRNIFHLFKDTLNFVTEEISLDKIYITLMEEPDFLKVIIRLPVKFENKNFQSQFLACIEYRLGALSAKYNIEQNQAEATQFTYEIPI